MFDINIQPLPRADGVTGDITVGGHFPTCSCGRLPEQAHEHCYHANCSLILFLGLFSDFLIFHAGLHCITAMCMHFESHMQLVNSDVVKQAGQWEAHKWMGC
jgi:hypothetical protein